jgi:hypothetical protein
MSHLTFCCISRNVVKWGPRGVTFWKIEVYGIPQNGINSCGKWWETYGKSGVASFETNPSPMVYFHLLMVFHGGDGHLGISINEGTPKLMLYNGNSENNMDDDWGFPHDLGCCHPHGKHPPPWPLRSSKHPISCQHWRADCRSPDRRVG